MEIKRKDGTVVKYVQGKGVSVPSKLELKTQRKAEKEIAKAEKYKSDEIKKRQKEEREAAKRQEKAQRKSEKLEFQRRKDEKNQYSSMKERKPIDDKRPPVNGKSEGKNKKKYEVSDKYNVQIITPKKEKFSFMDVISESMESKVRNPYDREIVFDATEHSAMVVFPRSGGLIETKCYVHTSCGELIAQCLSGDTVIFDCEDLMEISVRMKSGFKTIKSVIEAGDILEVKINPILGTIKFSDELSKYRKWINTIEKVRLIDSKDEAPRVTTKQNGVSAAARAVLGGALLGDLGAIAGAVSTKQKTVITKGKRSYKFYVLYKDGTDDILVLAEGEKCDDLLKLSYRQEAEK